jgi:hypothetical protein
MYFSYHNRTKQRIKNGEFENSEYVKEYNGIRPCLLLYFQTDPKIVPIREHRFKEYETIIL